MIALTLPYPVSGNRYWRSCAVRAKKTGKWRAAVYVSEDARIYREQVAWLARAAGVRSPLRGPVALTLRLYPARPKDWKKRARLDPDGWAESVRCIDLGNAEKIMSDALNGIAWVDDKQLRDVHKTRCVPDDKGARLEIEFAPMAPA